MRERFGLDLDGAERVERGLLRLGGNGGEFVTVVAHESLAIAHDVVAMGGAPLAEHGVGRSALKQELLRELYGKDGIEQMRQVKRALDPEGKLAAGVLFPSTA